MSVAATVSARKARANRRNSRKSTGPRTDSGKSRSSRNSLIHGLYAADHLLLEGESRASFLFLWNSYIKTLAPQDPIEMLIVERITLAKWKLNRLHALEQARHTETIELIEERASDDLAKLEQALDQENQPRSRYGWRDPSDPIGDRFKDLGKEELEQECKSRIRTIRSARKQRIPVAWIQRIQLTEEKGFDQFEKLHRMEQRLENSIYRAMRELERLRKSRKEQEELERSPYEADSEELQQAAEEEVQKLRNEATENEAEINDAQAKGSATLSPSPGTPGEAGVRVLPANSRNPSMT